MADITMCQQENCPRKLKCYRYTAPVNEFGQSVFICENPLPCENYIDNENMPNGIKIGMWWRK